MCSYLFMEHEMEDTKQEEKTIIELIKNLNDWTGTENGKKHKNFILSMIITLQHSSGSVPITELKEGKGLAILWKKDSKHYGVLLSNSGAIINVCKEEDGRMFASTKLEED